MAVDYSNLWKLLIDKHMNKTQLREAAKLSTNAIAKLGRNEPVSLNTLEKICISLSCKIEDVVTFININDQNLNTIESEK
ncbi:MAG: helix-turn-helix transcriptional regulator [Eubacterium sp.]|nr:helix-turn-helix transcriptional regulator [Eubacterium sp.]